jgi:hypothetical protein
LLSQANCSEATSNDARIGTNTRNKSLQEGK